MGAERVLRSRVCVLLWELEVRLVDGWMDGCVDIVSAIFAGEFVELAGCVMGILRGAIWSGRREVVGSGNAWMSTRWLNIY